MLVRVLRCCKSAQLKHATVIIKGTQVYDTNKGAFTDLSVLDVLQIFGRAGRPGLESSGEGYICTTEESLPHYLEAVTSQVGKIRRQVGLSIDSRISFPSSQSSRVE